MPQYDVAIIGGGLSGMLAAYELSQHENLNVALVDFAIPAANGRLGGFAKFSGAKFSRLPAGQGLIDVAGGLSALESVTGKALKFLGLDNSDEIRSSDLVSEVISTKFELRSYLSILLQPNQIDELIERSTGLLSSKISLIQEQATNIRSMSEFTIELSNGKALKAKKVLVAIGRASGALLDGLGARRQNGKGFDVGVRLEFSDKSALKQLRELGPDAKILSERMRTFCLNSPGSIYRYPCESFSIPGGIVAAHDHKAANVGILRRVTDKQNLLPNIIDKLNSMPSSAFEGADWQRGAEIRANLQHVDYAFGSAICNEVERFITLLHEERLINLDVPYKVHFPLLDWHWPVFALDKTHQTTVSGLYVAGDSAGHARGLLQAAVSGMLAAREIKESL